MTSPHCCSSSSSMDKNPNFIPLNRATCQQSRGQHKQRRQEQGPRHSRPKMSLLTTTSTHMRRELPLSTFGNLEKNTLAPNPLIECPEMTTPDLGSETSHLFSVTLGGVVVVVIVLMASIVLRRRCFPGGCTRHERFK